MNEAVVLNTYFESTIEKLNFMCDVFFGLKNFDHGQNMQ